MILRLLVPGLVVFVADQLTKMLVATRLTQGQSVLVASWVQLRLLTNPSRRRRLRQGRSALLLLWASVLVSIIVVVQYGYFFQHPVAQFGLGAALGGAAGNLYDRLRHGAVIDFVQIGWWPVFNVADVGITLGVAAALWFIRWP